MHQLKLLLYFQLSQMSLQESGSFSSADLTPDEIHKKVQVLIEENMMLKGKTTFSQNCLSTINNNFEPFLKGLFIMFSDTLQQNNLAMKKQFDTLVLWQEDVVRVHESHKQKFADTKKYIEKLKVENAKLSEALKLSDTDKTDGDTTSEAINTKLIDELNKRDKTIDELKQELAALKALGQNAKDAKENESMEVVRPAEEKSEVSKLIDELNKRNEAFEELEHKFGVIMGEKEHLETAKKEDVQKLTLLKTSMDNVKEFELETAQKKVIELEAMVSTDLKLIVLGPVHLFSISLFLRHKTFFGSL